MRSDELIISARELLPSRWLMALHSADHETLRAALVQALEETGSDNEHELVLELQVGTYVLNFTSTRGVVLEVVVTNATVRL